MQVMEVLVRNRHDREVREELAQAFGLLSDHAPTLTKQRWVSTVMQLQGVSLEAGERASISFSAEHSVPAPAPAAALQGVMHYMCAGEVATVQA